MNRLSEQATAFHDELWHWLESEDATMTQDDYFNLVTKYGTAAEQEVREYLREDGMVI